MANRKRLTKEGFSRRASDVENVDPNSLNRVRHVPDAEQYMTWDPEAHENHEKPDMRHDWQGDKDLRHPTLNVAMPGASRQANLALLRTAQTLAKKSSLAIKVASALFPDGTDTFIEKQATDLMDLPLRSLIDTVSRINKYAAESAEMDALEEEEGDMAGDDMAGDDMAAAPGLGMPPAGMGGGQEDWQKGGEEEEMADFGPPANMPEAMADVPPMDLEAPEEAEGAMGDEEDDSLDIGGLGGDADDKTPDGFGSALEADGEGDGDDNLDEDLDDAAQKDKMQQAIQASRTKTASKNVARTPAKLGVKKIASAPRANNQGSYDVSDLSRLWKSDPDVSDHFNY